MSAPTSPGSEPGWGGAPAEEESGGLPIPAFLFDPIGVLQRRWLWMLATCLVGIAATGVAAYLWKPAYLATATVLITSQQIPETFVRSTVREDSIENLNAMVGEVLSHEKLAQVLDELELYPDDRSEATQLKLVGRMRRGIDVYPTTKESRGASSILYAISFGYHESELAADTANALAALFVEASIQRRNRQAQRATAFLRRELERDERELKEVAEELSVFRRENRNVLPSQLDGLLRKLEFTSRERDSLVTRIGEKERQLAALNSGPQGVTLGPSENELILDGLRRELVGELSAHTEEHPNVAALRRRIAQQEQIVAEERRPDTGNEARARLLAANEAELVQLRQLLAAAREEIVALNARIDRVPGIGQDLDALQRKEHVLREDYLSSLRKVEEAELAEILESGEQGAQVSVLDPARPPGSPELPRMMIVAAGLAASLVLALAVAVLLELIDPVVVSTTQLEQMTGAPALGTVPRIA